MSAIGGKAWHFRYYWLDKQKRISLGNYPEIGLREARILRDDARALLTKGINPLLDRKQKRIAAQVAAAHTFQAVYDKWFEHRGRVLKEGRQTTLTQIRRVFKKDVLPALAMRSICEIKRQDLLDVLGRIERRKAFSQAEKVRTWFDQLFRYALVIMPGLEANPATLWMWSQRRSHLSGTILSCAWANCLHSCKSCAAIRAGCKPSLQFACSC